MTFLYKILCSIALLTTFAASAKITSGTPVRTPAAAAPAPTTPAIRQTPPARQQPPAAAPTTFKQLYEQVRSSSSNDVIDPRTKLLQDTFIKNMQKAILTIPVSFRLQQDGLDMLLNTARDLFCTFGPDDAQNDNYVTKIMMQIDIAKENL